LRPQPRPASWSWRSLPAPGATFSTRLSARCDSGRYRKIGGSHDQDLKGFLAEESAEISDIPGDQVCCGSCKGGLQNRLVLLGARPGCDRREEQLAGGLVDLRSISRFWDRFASLA